MATDSTGTDESTATRERQVLSDVSERPDWMGFSIFGLLLFLTPALTLFTLTAIMHPRPFWWVLLLATLAAAFGAFVAIAMTPDHITAGQYAKKLVNHYTQQPILIHD
ncbi:hypothetical protein QA600_21625 [Natronococcus sp. A-GB1]|uniref:hypothetical protein n=1 Tax=Natronococcus sp. A-GB1 TaxID=3037648 RepID=UPI00241CBE9A|nr:hypothetical protein [Natronococcus sp. A-GB1]MDG5761925.1 hypothetical protein [Natronococcus sp. A-GB1]